MKTKISTDPSDTRNPKQAAVEIEDLCRSGAKIGEMAELWRGRPWAASRCRAAFQAAEQLEFCVLSGSLNVRVWAIREPGVIAALAANPVLVELARGVALRSGPGQADFEGELAASCCAAASSSIASAELAANSAGPYPWQRHEADHSCSGAQPSMSGVFRIRRVLSGSFDHRLRRRHLYYRQRERADAKRYAPARTLRLGRHIGPHSGNTIFPGPRNREDDMAAFTNWRPYEGCRDSRRGGSSTIS